MRHTARRLSDEPTNTKPPKTQNNTVVSDRLQAAESSTVRYQARYGAVRYSRVQYSAPPPPKAYSKAAVGRRQLEFTISQVVSASPCFPVCGAAGSAIELRRTSRASPSHGLGLRTLLTVELNRPENNAQRADCHAVQNRTVKYDPVR